MLATLADTKTFLGINDNTKDAVLTILLNQASAYLEKLCGRTFSETVHTYEKHDGTGHRELRLDHFPVIVPPAVVLQKNRATDNTDDWETIDTENYWVNEDDGIITMTSAFLDFDDQDDSGLSESSVFTLGKNKYRVTYTAGYSSIPYDLQYACMTLVSEMMNKRKSGGIKSESLGDHSVVFQSIFSTSKEIQDIINSYRDINI